MKHFVAALIVVLVAVSGCAGKPSGQGQKDPTLLNGISAGGGQGDGGNGSRYDTFAAEGNMSADAANLGIDMSGQYAVARGLVPRTAQGLLAEMRWTGDVTAFDLVVQSPRFCPDGADTPQAIAATLACGLAFYATGESPGVFRSASGPADVGPSYLRLAVDADTISTEPCLSGECAWEAVPWWKLAVDSHYAVRLTVFYDGPVPDGFSAFDA